MITVDKIPLWLSYSGNIYKFCFVISWYLQWFFVAEQGY